ncbi:MAG: peptide chain release factor 1 [Nitrospinota bacterium]
MFEHLDQAEARLEALGRQLADPKRVAGGASYRALAREHAELSRLVETYRRYQRVARELEEAQRLLREGREDAELRALAEEEIREKTPQRESLEQELRRLMLPRDPNDERNVILEVRAGTGGDEATLFAGDLFRMYCRFAERRGWKAEVLSSHESDVGGFKEAIALLSGDRVYSELRFESGTHRVQRVPATEGQGRIHTSAVTVAVLPEAEEVEVELDPAELRIDVFRSSGPGGQSVNTTDSAVRLTHLPTGLVVSCQDEKSQHKNKARALKILRARLLDAAAREQEARRSQERRAQVGTGDRSERIRTYNFPQNRVTDHRFNLTLYKLDSFLGGELDPLVEAAAAAREAEKLTEMELGGRPSGAETVR